MARIDYWHRQHDMPENAKQKLRESIKGEVVEWLYPKHNHSCFYRYEA